MSLPKADNYFKRCKDFFLCILKSDANYATVEYPRTLYCYIVYGSTKVGKLFESDYKTLVAGNLYNMKEYIDDYTVMKTNESLFWIGFNVLKDQNWEGRLITEDFIVVDKKSYAVCFDGEPSINGKVFSQYDYSEITPGKKYKVDISSGVLGLFTKMS